MFFSEHFFPWQKNEAALTRMGSFQPGAGQRIEVRGSHLVPTRWPVWCYKNGRLQEVADHHGGEVWVWWPLQKHQSAKIDICDMNIYQISMYWFVGDLHFARSVWIYCRRILVVFFEWYGIARHFFRHRFLCMDVFLRHLVVIDKIVEWHRWKSNNLWGNGCIMPFHGIAAALEIFGGWYYLSFSLAGFWAILISKFHDLVSIWYNLYTLMIVENLLHSVGVSEVPSLMFRVQRTVKAWPSSKQILAEGWGIDQDDIVSHGIFM